MFKSDQFLAVWNEWKEHYAEIANHSYTSVAERKALSALWLKCSGREQLAIDSINHSMEKNWAAIYIINGNGQNINGNQSNNGKQGNAGSNNMEAYSQW